MWIDLLIYRKRITSPFDFHPFSHVRPYPAVRHTIPAKFPQQNSVHFPGKFHQTGRQTDVCEQEGKRISLSLFPSAERFLMKNLRQGE